MELVESQGHSWAAVDGRWAECYSTGQVEWVALTVCQTISRLSMVFVAWIAMFPVHGTCTMSVQCPEAGGQLERCTAS